MFSSVRNETDGGSIWQSEVGGAALGKFRLGMGPKIKPTHLTSRDPQLVLNFNDFAGFESQYLCWCMVISSCLQGVRDTRRCVSMITDEMTFASGRGQD